MTNRAIARLGALFIVLFALLGIKQFIVMVVAGPQIAAKPYNPRHASLDERRGRILASDGTPLAYTRGKTRIYPFADALAQSVGYVSARYGTSGIEAAYDRALTPADTTGDIGAQLDDIGTALQGRSQRSRGADVVTTIVPAIQNALWSQLSRYDRGAGIVLDPNTGAVLAIASVPSYDPNQFDAIFSELNNDTSSPLIDRATSGLYPPGSTFKIFTASAALDSQTITMDSTWDDPGYYVLGNFTFHDNEGEATGMQDLTGAFALSSNVDFAQIALKMGTATFFDYLNRWGIGQSTDFQLDSQNDSVPSQASVVPGELAQMGFGQGALLMTPLRMALVASTIADDGNEPRPFIVRQIVRDGHVASVTPTGSLASPISADTASEVKKMMIAVVEHGTGTSAQIPHVAVAGKTGTATNPHGAAHSWFVCFAPADHPRVAVAIIVENAGYGATVAAPIARQVLQASLAAIKE